MNYLHIYSSIAKLVEAANGKSEMSPTERSSRILEKTAWAGASWADALSMARSGDLKGARRLAPKIADAVNSYVHAQKRLDPVYKLDEGRWIDVARFVKGEPECWGDMVETDPTPRRAANVVFNIAATGDVPASAMDRIGEAVASAVLGLQATGHSVTVYLAACSDSIYPPKAHTGFIGAPLNPGGGTIDVSMLSAIIRPWFFRKIIFSLKETFNREYRERFNVGSGYGRARPLTKQEARKMFSLAEDPIIIDIMASYRNPDQVFERLINQIKEVK
jgi:hypothetical protein